jgi:methyl-accepting chemotaxis protein
MSWFKNLGLKGMLLCLVSAGALGILVLGLAALFTINRVKVDGPFYAQIVEGRDLIADVLPPPEYIIEPYLTAHEIGDETDQNKLAKLTAQFDKLRAEYVARHDYWKNTLPEGELKTALVETSYEPAMAFFRTYDQKFLPTVMAGKVEEARGVLMDPMQGQYDEHRAAIEKVVALGEQHNSEVGANATASVQRSYWWLIGAHCSCLCWHLLGPLVLR